MSGIVSRSFTALLVLIGAGVVAMKGCSYQARGEAKALCDQALPGMSAADLRKRAESAGREGFWSEAQADFVYPWTMDNAWVCRVKLDQERVVGRELRDCGFIGMTPQSARAMGGEVAAQVGEDDTQAEYIEVNVCEVEALGG